MALKGLTRIPLSHHNDMYVKYSGLFSTPEPSVFSFISSGKSANKKTNKQTKEDRAESGSFEILNITFVAFNYFSLLFSKKF